MTWDIDTVTNTCKALMARTKNIVRPLPPWLASSLFTICYLPWSSKHALAFYLRMQKMQLGGSSEQPDSDNRMITCDTRHCPAAHDDH